MIGQIYFKLYSLYGNDDILCPTIFSSLEDGGAQEKQEKSDILMFLSQIFYNSQYKVVLTLSLSNTRGILTFE